MARPAARHGERLRRVLAMLPWLLEEGTTTVGAVAERFGVSEDDVIADVGLIALCGIPPYSMGDLVEVFVDEDGTIEAFDQGLFNQPLNLTPAEGFAVLAAGQALLAVPGAVASGPLASALAKLEAALDAAGSLRVDLEAPPLLDVVRTAAEDRERIHVTYYSAWRDELTERVIEPWLVHSHEGRWYVEGHDSMSGERRRFRVDRLRTATPTGEHFDPVPVDVPDDVFAPGPDARRVRLVLPPAGRWAVEAYAVESVGERSDGRLDVTLWVAGVTWLERLLLKVGPEAEVVEPDELADLPSRAATRVLARYR